MEKEQILKYFQDFIRDYNATEKDEVWQQYSGVFHDFWNNRILNPQVKELDDFEIDSIIRMIDKHAKGNTVKDEAIAKIMIPQGVWRKMFNQIKTDKGLFQRLTSIFNEQNSNNKAELINELYKYNEPHRNSLTGKSSNAINAFLFLWSPTNNISLVSLGDRHRLIKFLNIKGPDFDSDTQGEKVLKSNETIISYFKSIFGSQYSPRTICTFFYNSPLTELWKSEEIGDGTAPWGGWGKKPQEQSEEAIQEERLSGDPALFYMESQLEDFLIENWDKTELGKKYDLIEEDGEEVSQQYQTDIGRIDILAQDKKTKQLVVIELKKNQTSDDTIGQLARYMG